ncbi:MAG: type I methionyl aminopeptidase [Anaerolineae bacterium]|nr:type I methionyl aminopeptidase [Anaerolineae bacterium]
MNISVNGLDIHLKTPDEIDAMRAAGQVVYQAHMAMRDAVRPGVSTAELDHIAETVIRDHGATPVFKGYPKKDSPDFPATITASINHELVHGIPSPKRVLKDGDIISLDCGCTYQGFVGDSAYTWAVGEVAPSVLRLLEVTEGALYEAIRASVLPHETRDVALATGNYVARHGYSVAREYTGHGVGKEMHEEPQVPNWWPSGTKARRLNFVSVPLQPGMTFAIEPMVIAGRAEFQELKDKWTVVTKDRSLCAHYEHTIAVTDGEPIILTLP